MTCFVYFALFVAGLIVGALYFGSLQWILKKITTKKINVASLISIFFLKLSIIAVILYFLLTKLGWKSVPPFLAGMIIFNLFFAGYQTKKIRKEKNDRA
jgi:hypothetical protein